LCNTTKVESRIAPRLIFSLADIVE